MIIVDEYRKYYKRLIKKLNYYIIEKINKNFGTKIKPITNETPFVCLSKHIFGAPHDQSSYLLE